MGDSQSDPVDADNSDGASAVDADSDTATDASASDGSSTIDADVAADADSSDGSPSNDAESGDEQVASLRFLSTPRAWSFELPLEDVAVELVDSQGRRVVEDSERTIIIQLEETPSDTAFLNGTTTAQAIDGVVTFEDLYLSEIGLPYRLRAVSSDVEGDVSPSFGAWFYDDFEDGALDLGRWDLLGDAAFFTEEGGALVVTPPAGDPSCASDATHCYGLLRSPVLDFTGFRANVTVLQVLTVMGSPSFEETELCLRNADNPDQRWCIFSEGGDVHLGRIEGFGSWQERVRLEDDQYHLSTWSIRHDLALNSIVIETSTDGTSWTTHFTGEMAYPITSAFVSVGAGVYGDVPDPGSALFDSVRIGP